MEEFSGMSFKDDLAGLGFGSYAEYLRSALWFGIRARVYGAKGRTCLRCKSSPATQIHHTGYDLATLSGLSLNKLVPICDPCHEREHGLARRKSVSKGPDPIVIPWNGRRDLREHTTPRKPRLTRKARAKLKASRPKKKRVRKNCPEAPTAKEQRRLREG